MQKRISVGAAAILIIISIVITFQITYLSVNNKYKNLMNNMEIEYSGNSNTENSNNLSDVSLYSKLATVDEVVRSTYVGEIDEDYLSDYIIRGYIAGIGDKYAYYMTSEEYVDFISEQNGELVGIGVMVIYNGDYSAIEVVTVMPDSPALEAGVLPGDLIVTVEGESVGELGYYPAIARVKGEEGTSTNFQVLRIDSEGFYNYIDFSIARAPVTSLSVTYRQYQDTNIGIIKILQFDATTPSQFKEAITNLKANGVEKFIFDVRNNPGGELNSITSILDYLLPEGPIIRAVDNQGNWTQIDSDAAELDAEMVVIVNSNTASAAELFSSAMKDYNKATLVGTLTYGKGTMQSVMTLPDYSAISVSTAMYYPPFSDNYEGVGVEPHIIVELPAEVADKNLYKVTDEEDTQLQTAIGVLEGTIEVPDVSLNSEVEN